MNRAAVHYYGLYCIDPTEHCAVAVWPSGGHKAETDQRSAVTNFVTTRPEILCRILPVETARTLLLCCVFSNCMEYGASWDVLIDQIMYKLLSVTKHDGSVSGSECLPLFSITFRILATVQCHVQNACHCSVSHSECLPLFSVTLRMFATVQCHVQNACHCSVSSSECLPLFTAVTFGVRLGLGLCLPVTRVFCR